MENKIRDILMAELVRYNFVSHLGSIYRKTEEHDLLDVHKTYNLAL